MFDQDRPAGVDRIRAAAHDWLWPLALAAFFLALAAFVLALGAAGPPALVHLALAVLLVLEGLWLRTLGTELASERVVIRGIRRRELPWRDVADVVRHRRLGTWLVQLVRTDGVRIVLRAPTTYWGVGQGRYERDFQRIRQWWLAHRGPGPPDGTVGA